MPEADFKLVLNINTPNYFENTGFAAKRRLDAPFATICAKKPKLSLSKLKVVGRSFQRSSKTTKLKLTSSLNAIQKNNVFKERRSITSEEQSKKKDSSKNNSKPNVSFNTNVKVFPINNKEPVNNSNNNIQNNSNNNNNVSKLLKPNYIFSKLNPTSEKANLKETPTTNPKIASLFTKNPNVPILRRGDVKSSTKEVFSTTSFKELDISPKLVSTVEKFGYTSLTTVQHLSIPLILEGKDALIKSQTGSGKTLCYALPIVHQIMAMGTKVDRNHGLLALIVVPTRELAIQTYQLFEKLCKTCVWVVPGYLMGGEKKKAEKARLRKGLNILVTTPGRLMDHINNTNSLSLSAVRVLVLDEADRMLEMGYEKSIQCIIESLKRAPNPDSRQTLLLSATLTPAVERLAGMSLVSPELIDVTVDLTSGGQMSSNDFLVTPKNLKNHFMLVPSKLRLVSLAAFIIEKCKLSGESKMLVFMTTQDMVDYYTSLFAHVVARLGRRKRRSALESEAEKVLSGGMYEGGGGGGEDDEDEEMDEEKEGDIQFMRLHGNMTQSERTAVFKSFREATSGVLFCTDVASRGLDVPCVDWIVQFSPAFLPADFVHRVGRTARADREGHALVFVTPAEANYVTMLENQGILFEEIGMESTLKQLIHPSLYDKEAERLPSNMEVAATRLQDKFETAVEQDKALRGMAAQGYVSFVRSYAAIPRAAREHFQFRLLHLGHCAKAFALRDPPGVLGARGSKTFKKGGLRSYREVERRGRGSNEAETDTDALFKTPKKVISEFDSGLEAFDQKKKGKKKAKMGKGKAKVGKGKVVKKGKGKAKMGAGKVVKKGKGNSAKKKKK